MNISEIGQLNLECSKKQYFWGIKKNSWENFYHVEVSSQNFDGRPSFHEEYDFIDDAFYRMLEFIKSVELKVSDILVETSLRSLDVKG